MKVMAVNDDMIANLGGEISLMLKRGFTKADIEKALNASTEALISDARTAYSKAHMACMDAENAVEELAGALLALGLDYELSIEIPDLNMIDEKLDELDP